MLHHFLLKLLTYSIELFLLPQEKLCVFAVSHISNTEYEFKIQCLLPCAQDLT